MKRRILPLSFVSLLAVTACSGHHYGDMSQYVAAEFNYKNNFRILQLTDLHLSDKDTRDIHYKFMDLTVNDAKPDMIVVTGDLFTFASMNVAKELFDYLDSKGVPWTVTLGNHDEQCYFSVDWVTNYLNNYGSNCVFKDLQDDDLQGNCNFVINLKENGKVRDQIFIMDSNRYYYGDYFGYDFFKPEQIQWYEDMVKYTKDQNGGTVNSLMFYHIPLPEINDAWEKGEKIYDKGEKREACCPPDYNSGFFKKIKELGSTSAMFFGHDHVNNFINKYEGVIFGYGIKSTDRIYHADDMMGGRVIILKDDHSLDYQHIYHQYSEVK